MSVSFHVFITTKVFAMVVWSGPYLACIVGGGGGGCRSNISE